MPKISVGSTSGDKKQPRQGRASGCFGFGKGNGCRRANEYREDGHDDRDLEAGPGRGEIGLGTEDFPIPAQGEAARRKDKKLAFREGTRDHHAERNKHHECREDDQGRGQQASGSRRHESGHWRVLADRAYGMIRSRVANSNSTDCAAANGQSNEPPIDW